MPKMEVTAEENKVGWKSNHHGECFYLGFVCAGRWHYQHLAGRGHERYRQLFASLLRRLRSSGTQFNHKLARDS